MIPGIGSTHSLTHPLTPSLGLMPKGRGTQKAFSSPLSCSLSEVETERGGARGLSPLLKGELKLVIACPWEIQRIHFNHLLNLKEIIQKSEKNIIFRIFTKHSNNALFVLLRKELHLMLGEKNVEVIPNCPYQEYMRLSEGSDIVLDSFHFGAYNSVIDGLYAGKPVITLEGEKAYNRFSGAVLRKLELSELVTNTNEEFIDKTLQLINDDIYRDFIKNKIKNSDLDELFKPKEPFYFKQVIDTLINNLNL